MSPIGIIRYIFFSALIVISLFLSLRMLFAHDIRREAWRTSLKRRVYVSRPRFKSGTILLGWILLFFALYMAYLQLEELVANQN